MAKEEKLKKNNGKKPVRPRLDLHPETKKTVLGIIFFAVSAILVFSYFGSAGRAGVYIYQAFHAFLGVGFFLVPLTLFIIAVGFFRSLKTNLYFTSVFGGVLFLVSFLGLLTVIYGQWGAQAQDASAYPAGYLGFAITHPFLYFFGTWVSLLLFAVGGLIAVSISFNTPFLRRRETEDEENAESFEEEKEEALPEPEIEKPAGFSAKAIAAIGEKISKQSRAVELPPEQKKISESASSSQKVSDFVVETHQQHYQIPPVDLLEKDSGKPNAGDAKAYAEIIRRTLSNFGIEVEMGEANVGPTVTQYTLKPAQGIKLSRIVALQNDLSLSLAAHPLRIEAPIPGRSLVGIEIPNKAVALVRLRNLIENPAFVQAPPLTIVLGRDVSGNPQYADIERMPHLLIAGATGAGKSVCIHTILTSLLYKNFPQILKFLMIDPKRIELIGYNGIPHLLAPVVVDRNRALAALRWAVKEMERRYEFLSQFSVRNIGSYNAKAAKSTAGSMDIMPYIIVVIDELADLMATSAKEAEASIVRLAQMSRAVGIHLIISTQRPSVEVITGLIKANIPCRISFQVSSLVDSRTILDMSGAEKLIGNGDMLFLPQDISKPRRIQGGFVSEKEVKRVTDYIREVASSPEFVEETQRAFGDVAGELDKQTSPANFSVDLDRFSSESGDDDEMLEEAKKVIAQAGKASTSLLQRRLKLGYARAARIMDVLEEAGHIGPQEGAKPREVYIIGSEADKTDEIL